MRLTDEQIDEIAWLREGWNYGDRKIQQLLCGWPELSARAGVEREFYRRLVDVCEPDHDLTHAEAILAGQVWWKAIKREAFLNIREEIQA